ncbi:MAG TPA: hypothetical protein VNR42_08715 [Solirubrobacteraceae bacterium]|nr:hypothetical protein [Solirubrobacteraceae bacterium]
MMPDPFGEQLTPWWRSSDWWRKRLRGSKSGVPTRYSRPLAAFSAIVGAVAIGEHLDLAETIVVGAVATGIPSIFLERRWKQRRRYESERLLISPEASDRERS